MKISVRVLATREQVLRGTTLRIDMPASSTLADVLRAVAETDRNLVCVALDMEPTIGVRPGFALLLNGVNTLHAPRGLDTPVAEGDTLSLIHGITGG